MPSPVRFNQVSYRETGLSKMNVNWVEVFCTKCDRSRVSTSSYKTLFETSQWLELRDHCCKVMTTLHAIVHF